MKSIILMRHSIPDKINISNSLIPLSEAGKKLALSKRKEFSYVNRCYSSSYKRAFETARLIMDNVVIVDGLHERIIGDADADFWINQYKDYDFRNPNGESLNDVKVRMKKVIDSIVENMEEEETVLIVSHATAICSYLLNYCRIEVVDVASKSRKITFRNQEVLNGKFNPTDYFEIDFRNNSLYSIRFRG